MNFKSVMNQTCPKCGEGKMFKSLIKMNEFCPKCGLSFFPEHGYYLGAMMVSYLITAGIFTPIAWYSYIETSSLLGTIFAIAIMLTILSPIIFRISRSIFLHFDFWTEPREK